MTTTQIFQVRAGSTIAINRPESIENSATVLHSFSKAEGVWTLCVRTNVGRNFRLDRSESTMVRVVR